MKSCAVQLFHTSLMELGIEPYRTKWIYCSEKYVTFDQCGKEKARNWTKKGSNERDSAIRNEQVNE